MRTFIAISIPENVKQNIYNTTLPLQEKWAGVKWIKKSRMHITLIFLGDISSEQVSFVSRVMEEPVFNIESFIIEYSELRQFPPSGYPRVIYTGLKRGHREIESLYDSLYLKIGSVIQISNRKYSPHITLARVKERNRLPNVKDMEIEINGKYTAGKFVFYQSILSSAGAQYRSITTRHFMEKQNKKAEII